MRLRRSQEFQQVWSEGRSWAHYLFILWATPNTLSYTRVGLIASKKVGNAVARNRARRLLREAVRQRYSHIKPGWDLVLVARTSLLEVKEPQVGFVLEKLLHRAHLWEPFEEN